MKPTSNMVVALVTARGGSKGLPGKNMKYFLGKPLIGWTIDAALNCQAIDRTILSTDDVLTAEYAKDAGCEVPFMRPEELATDEASHIDVVLHTLDFLKQKEGQLPKALIVLQPTSPMRTSSDIEMAIQLYHEHGFDAVISVCEPAQHPCLSKTIDSKGVMHNLFALPSGHPRRQDLPVAYAPNGAIFLLDVKAFLEQRVFYMKRTGAYVMPKERSIDIDHQYDFDMAEFLMKKKSSE